MKIPGLEFVYLKQGTPEITMKILPYFFFALLLSGCKDHTKPVEKQPSDFEEPLLNSEEFLRSYVKNPSLNDRMCKDDIERAKKDLKKYKNIYVTTSCFGCKTPPYADERIEYATKNHFKVINNDYSCVVIDGQIQGCYKALVDLKMEEIHGKDFGKKIEQAAEELMIEKIKTGTKILSVYDLSEEEKPNLIQENKVTKKEDVLLVQTGLPLQYELDTYPFIDLSFIVEKDGTISNLKNENWVSGFNRNEKYKNELENLAKNKILTDYSKWRPGKYKNTLTRVENNFRVCFK
ncbi:hypothetical protein H5J24_05685 [Chryseobacterium capnotolerans]|uniref:hypothetical protein n=2 Tax=Chryseobacterium group TaxID=2782232 RepID=UPI00083A1244|nr:MULTISPECIES: hypothetical protein [Chryseobacterium]UHO39578.1 hypothetical protein H5J24_05685 [Chryseobacterium capnotolerans]